jgi:RNA-directed DNA polymerase
VNDTTKEQQPTAVLRAAKQAGEVRVRWTWTEPSVWNERMLTTLEQGVKGGCWFSLIDKVWKPANLQSAFRKVKANGGAAGVDRVTVKDFERRLEENLNKVAEQLRTGTYQPQPIRRVWIPKPGSSEKRPLGIPTVRDRVVQAALRQVVEPIFEREFAEHSYGFRPQRGAKDALRRVQQLLDQGYHWIVDADLRRYFDTIPQAPMMARVREKVTDGRVLDLITAFLQQPVMETDELWTPEEGTPQGAVISPLLANLYLNPLDHLMAQHGIEMVRYADDFVLLCRSESEARQALAWVQEWTASAGLTLHPDKTRIVDATQRGGFDFLGYHFERGYRWPREKSLKKMKDTVREKTGRTNGQSLRVIIEDLNATLRGWFQYFQHSHRNTFSSLDKWIRMRLRSILRKRQGRKGRGRGSDHQRWNNRFFLQEGLFCLSAAHAEACQSSMR